MTHTTETAQRRLLEALAELRRTPGLDHGTADNPLEAVGIGVRFSAQVFAEGAPEQVAMSHVYTAFADLVTAVDAELRGVSHG